MSSSYSSSSDEEAQSTISRCTLTSTGLVSNIFSSLPQPHNPPPTIETAMEDSVWNDMNALSSLQPLHNNNSNNKRPTGTRIFYTFQDFLGSSVDPRNASSSSSTSPPTPLTQNPATALGLTTANIYNSSQNSLGPVGPYLSSPTNPSYIPSSRESRSSISTGTDNPTHLVQKRNKRLMKNRESAARSRDRKQAYTIELEDTNTLLREEIRMLREQLEKLSLSQASQQEARSLEEKPRLQRSISAPF